MGEGREGKGLWNKRTREQEELSHGAFSVNICMVMISKSTDTLHRPNYVTWLILLKWCNLHFWLPALTEHWCCIIVWRIFFRVQRHIDSLQCSSSVKESGEILVTPESLSPVSEWIITLDDMNLTCGEVPEWQTLL
jgi:hypothetical protein